MINRYEVVTRHNPRITGLEKHAPLSIGNREFGFSVDLTGLQSFQESYETPFGTQSNWAWHSTGGHDLYQLEDAVHQPFESNGRIVHYPMKPGEKELPYHWLRQNPHRQQLGRIGFLLYDEQGERVEITELEQIDQQLDLWSGIITSLFVVNGVTVKVETCVHASRSCIAVRVQSELCLSNQLHIELKFPAPDMLDRGWAGSVFPDWDNDDRHSSMLSISSETEASIIRTMDEDQYALHIHWSSGSIQERQGHYFVITPDCEQLEAVFHFSPELNVEGVAAEEVFASSRQWWQTIWSEGGIVDLSKSKDKRAFELERRIILSLYLTAIHSAGSMPPQETGYMYNSWFGKMHLEMHWWHAAHFPMWGRPQLLATSMDWYLAIMPKAKQLAQSQGYAGVRWPKMVAFDGKQTPSPVAPGLIWQQPHPIALLELLYRASPTEALLEKFSELVYETAQFMVDYATYDEGDGRYHLGPPLIPAQECHRMQDSMDPPYELEYWKYALETACQWMERQGKAYPKSWKEVAENIARPVHADGVYLAHANCDNTFTEKNHDHPSMVGAFGILEGKLIDRQIMKQTLQKVIEVWEWDSAWGWDFPMCAMTAARLGEPELAIEFLLMDAEKNSYLPNGHNYQRKGLSAYLPGNGALLIAVALMIAGWKGREQEQQQDQQEQRQGQGQELQQDQQQKQQQERRGCPGFPSGDDWVVEWENIQYWQ